MVPRAEARKDELLGEMVLTLAAHYGFVIDPIADEFNIDPLRLCLCDMLDGAERMPYALRTAAEEWWTIEFRQAAQR